MSVANPEIFKAYDIRGLYGADIGVQVLPQRFIVRNVFTQLRNFRIDSGIR